MPPENDATLVYRIVSSLEEHGVHPETYRLFDTVDPSALEALVASANPELQVSFDVRGLPVVVFGDGQVVVINQ